MFSLCFMCKRGVMRRELRMRVINYIPNVYCVSSEKKGWGKLKLQVCKQSIIQTRWSGHVGAGLVVLLTSFLRNLRLGFARGILSWWEHSSVFAVAVAEVFPPLPLPFLELFSVPLRLVHWDYVIMSFNSSPLVRLIRICKNFWSDQRWDI